MLQGLETGHATLGVVGTVSRSLVPALVVEMRRVAPALSEILHRDWEYTSVLSVVMSRI